MIASVRGTVAEVRSGSVVVLVGGLGLELLAPARTLARCGVGAEVALHARLVVREDSLTLYGFHEPGALALFAELLNVSGVGPKVALALLSAHDVATIHGAIGREDAKLLATAPGIGRRIAERIVVELRDRVGTFAPGDAPAPADPQPAVADAIEALLALGYRDAQVRTVVQELTATEPAAGAESLIRRALARLR